MIYTKAVYIHAAKSSRGINHALRGFFSRVSRFRDVRRRMLGRRVARSHIRRRSAKVKRDVKCKVGYCAIKARASRLFSRIFVSDVVV